jgi:deleted-in-malignant-brain-tumors protein 1
MFSQAECPGVLFFVYSGMLSSASESFFAYNLPGDSFDDFPDLMFEPAFAPVFDDPVLQETAETLCGDDEFCLFDIAATKMVDVGMATMMDVREFDTIVELAQPSECIIGNIVVVL